MIELYTTMSQLGYRDYAIFRQMIKELCTDELETRLISRITPTNTEDTALADFMEIFGPSSEETISEIIKTPEKP